MFQISGALLTVQNADYFVLPIINLLLVSMTISVVLAAAFPDLNALLLYGKTREASSRRLQLLPSFDWLLGLYLPKRCFVHFYIVSVVCSLAVIVFRWSQPGLGAWVFTGLLLVQGVRRLLECLLLEKQNPKALIHISHYIVGILFYVIVNCIAFYVFNTPVALSVPYLVSTIIVFTGASVYQCLIHAYLTSLVKYTLPTFSLFRLVSCPHYLAEIFIYASFLFLTPRTCLLSVCLTVVWVLINLSVSAKQTQVYYQKKFDTTQPYAIVPYIY